MLEALTAAPPDPILGLTEAFQKDPNPDKINLGVGVYKDAQGVTPILACVKNAEQRLVERQASKSYLPIDGHVEFDRQVPELMLGAGHPVTEAGRGVTVQTPGGTGALRLAADFIREMLPTAAVWCSRPTWANHPNVFRAAGLRVREYAYFDATSNALALDQMLADLGRVPAGDVVLLHGCCHNPSGVDPSPQQWRMIGETLANRGVLPLIDFAYQGFGDGLTEDAAGLRTLVDHNRELLVCGSFSKNFGLYCERVGALLAVADSGATAQVVLSQLKRLVRVNYSNPPAHGAAIVSTILGDEQLTRQWQAELETMRDRIHGMRQLFVQRMRDRSASEDFGFITRQRGMFSFSGLSPEQVDRLRQEFSIYIVRSGRINVAGITERNVDRLCEAIAAVL
jgi:aspartate/tyrosine/aromatic aminotransferase